MAISIVGAERCWAGTTAKDHMYGQVYFTFFASQLESSGRGQEAGPLWQTIGASQDIQTRSNPAATFACAVEIVSLPDSADKVTHDLTVWLWGNGLQQLTDERLQDNLDAFVASEPGGVLLERLKQFIGYQIPYGEVTSKHDLGSFPECYLKFISVLLVTKLPQQDNGDIRQLRDNVKLALEDLEFQRIVGLYGTITDTRQFAIQLQNKIEEVQ